LETGTQRWVMGLDNSDGDKFKISSDGDLNTNARLTIDTSGNATFAGKISNTSSNITPIEIESTGAYDNHFNFRKTSNGGGNARINIFGRRESSNSDCAGLYFHNMYSGTDRNISRIISNTTDSNGLSGTLRFATSNGGTLTDALTLAHDQAATFAGTVTVNTAGSSIAQESWIAPTLLNSWVNYGSAFSIAGYYKDSNGIVHLRGLVKNGSNTTVIFQLPAGYRPEYRTLNAVVTDSNAIGRVDVLANGNVHGDNVSSGWCSLDDISFRAYS